MRRQGVWTTLGRQLSRQYTELLHYESWFTRRLSKRGPLRSIKGQYQIRSTLLIDAWHLYAHVVHALLLATMAVGLAAWRPGRTGWWSVVAGFLVYNAGLFLVLNVNPAISSR